MAEPTLDEKIAFFGEIDKLAALDRLDQEDDKLDEEEQQHRETCRAFFGPRTKNAIQSRRHLDARSKPQAQLPPKPAHHPLLRRAASLPISTGVSTPAGPRGRPNPQIGDTTSFIEETPVPETVRPRQPTTLTRSTTMPLPGVSRAGAAEQSPSTTTALRKRKRQPATGKQVPASAQLFNGLSFYYIPNNNSNPTRKLRIGKAQEYGARWTRDLSGASHVVVDKNLSYTDIQKILGFSPNPSLILVNEDYPIDCVSFRSLLNPDQQKYWVSGFPSAQNKPPTVGQALATTSPENEQSSLQIKELPKAGTRESTPANEDAPPQKAPSTPKVQNEKPSPRHSEPAPGDELSEYIELLKQYKDLPLDNDEDDSSSTKDAPEDVSEPESASEDERARKRPATRPRRSLRKTIPFEERFACNHGGTKDKIADDSSPNARTIEILQSMCDYYTRINDHWRTTAYRKAIATLRRQNTKVTTEEEAYRLPNIGRRLAMKIEEIVTTNRLRRLDQANAQPLDKSLRLFLGIYGVGLNKATKWVSQGFRTLDDLRQKADLTTNQRVGIEHYRDLNTRIPRQEVSDLGEFVKREASLLDSKVEILIGGSYRRGADSSGDIDLIITKRETCSSAELVPFLEKLIETLYEKQFLVATLAALHTQSRSKEPGSKFHGCCVLPSAEIKVWRRIDFLLVPEAEYGAALIYFTGNDIFNRSMRLLASKKGMRLNQRGLYRDVIRGRGRNKVTEGELIEGRDEKKIFEILGVTWREPRERWC
ncbi:hypothetical protein QBC42DRAFT_221308 [Cladorrhinum samala]|uniref:DNA-directed DNA polymerase n=1 Tax=Cladorrhinum samala TaxID=585594 RepID=A0AAV9HYL5_9PEZI|nr:hypothetical protein QBC42DRAFT_221308 [Cladorrhinum samala]